MNVLLAFAILGLVIHHATAFARNAIDKHDRFPKAVWNLVPWALGLILAWAICAFHVIAAYFDLPTRDCATYVLVGLGFGSVATFWHSVIAFLGRGTTSPNPKGMRPARRSR